MFYFFYFFQYSTRNNILFNYIHFSQKKFGYQKRYEFFEQFNTARTNNNDNANNN